MSNDSPKLAAESVFLNMFSLLRPSKGNWPSGLVLPDPSLIPLQSVEIPKKFPMGNKKDLKTITACPHPYRKHYAKNMCNNCYHRLGRDKNAWECKHSERKHYAKGKCQVCYLREYNKSRQNLPVAEC